MKTEAKYGKIVAVFNQKGGSAKTQTSMQLAGALGSNDLDCFVADMDEQNTAHLWAMEADIDRPFPAQVLSMAPYKERVIERLAPIVVKKDIVIIDCPPAISSPVPWAALLVADLAIIPVMPNMDNVWSSRVAEEMAVKAMETNKKLKVVYLVTAYRRGKGKDHAVDKLRERAKFPILEGMIHERNVYSDCQIFSCYVGDFGASAALTETNNLARDVLALLEIKHKIK